jgi:hypothetical protein
MNFGRRISCMATNGRTELSVLENNLVDHPVVLGLLGIHDEIAFDVFFDAVDRLPAVLGQKLVDGGAHAQDFFGVKIDVGGLARRARTSTAGE